MAEIPGAHPNPPEDGRPPSPADPPPAYPQSGGLPSAPMVSPTEGGVVPDRFLGRNAPLYGIGIGTLSYGLGYGLSFLNGRDSQGYWALAWLGWGLLVSLVLFVVGIVLVIGQRTRALGAGLLISIAIGVVVGSGVCIALLGTA